MIRLYRNIQHQREHDGAENVDRALVLKLVKQHCYRKEANRFYCDVAKLLADQEIESHHPECGCNRTVQKIAVVVSEGIDVREEIDRLAPAGLERRNLMPVRN